AIACKKCAPHSISCFIRTFYVILELPADILEVLGCLLENPDHLFEHRRLILEDRCFIRTFTRLLEHFTNILETQSVKNKKPVTGMATGNWNFLHIKLSRFLNL
ncbi:MAG: hypothetical protein ABS884_08980, partial [Solibacillus isronensis]